MARSDASVLLFVRGNAAAADAAISLVTRALSRFPERRLEVIDVFREPERARNHGVVATPTLISVVNATERRVVGELSDENVRECLEGTDVGVRSSHERG